MRWIQWCFGFESGGRPLCTPAPDHNPRHVISALRAATVHGLEPHIATRLTNGDANISVATGTGSSEIAGHTVKDFSDEAQTC